LNIYEMKYIHIRHVFINCPMATEVEGKDKTKTEVKSVTLINIKKTLHTTLVKLN